VIVIHENRGLNPYIEDVARRLAVEGYVAFAPDALAPAGGYPGNEDRRARDVREARQREAHEDLLAACSHLKRVPEFNGKFGAVGFCFGGGIVNTMATRIRSSRPACRSTGAAPRGGVPKIKAAMQMHYAEQDPNINSGSTRTRRAAIGRREARNPHLPQDPAWIPQRHDAALRRGGREARLVAHARLVQAAPRLSR
jgi:carboxymethylenebutenolidase